EKVCPAAHLQNGHFFPRHDGPHPECAIERLRLGDVAHAQGHVRDANCGATVSHWGRYILFFIALPLGPISVDDDAVHDGDAARVVGVNALVDDAASVTGVIDDHRDG